MFYCTCAYMKLLNRWTPFNHHKISLAQLIFHLCTTEPPQLEPAAPFLTLTRGHRSNSLLYGHPCYVGTRLIRYLRTRHVLNRELTPDILSLWR